MQTTEQTEIVMIAEVSQKNFIVHRDVTLKFDREETKAKAGTTAIQYWKLDLMQLMEKSTDAQGQEYIDYCLGFETLAHLMGGMSEVVSELQSRLDLVLRNAQLKGGKDVHDMDTKLARVVEYVRNDFGRSKPTKADTKLNELAETNKELASKLKRCQWIVSKLFGSNDAMLTIAERTALETEFKSLSI